MENWAILGMKAYAFVGNTWQEIIWDSIPLLCWIMLFVAVARNGRVAEGRIRLLVGLALLVAASFLDVTDEFLGLSDMAIVGRLDPIHEKVETLLYVFGLGLFASALRGLFKYR